MAEKPEENKDKNKKRTFGARFSANNIGKYIKRYGTSVYMILAFCLVAAVTLSVLTINMNYSDVNDEITIPDISIPTIPDVVVIKPTEKQVGSVQTGVDNRIVETNSPERTPETTKAAVNYVSPVTSGKITKKYSVDALVFSSTLGDYRTHSGIDIEAPLGSPVVAYSGGTVVSIEDTPMMGKAVTVTHKYGISSVYMNLDEELAAGITVGANVSAGDMIGKIGKTAIAEIGEAPHLHFEIKLNDANIDPEKELMALK